MGGGGGVPLEVIKIPGIKEAKCKNKIKIKNERHISSTCGISISSKENGGGSSVMN